MRDPTDKENDLKRQSRHLPNGREIDEGDTVYFDRRLARKDCQLPDWDIPDAAYRPVPIVWFTSAFLAHLVVSIVLFMILGGSAPWLPIVLCTVAAGGVWKWTWDRGMRDARMGWKIATVVMLSVNVLYVIAVALSV
ncbi:MAG: hypothetical protein AAGL10_02250 [Pseudomonadota bacterium]